MTVNQNMLPIGVFDSGVGGISVLAEIIRHLPGERYIYLADSANAPYGSKSCELVRKLSMDAAATLYSRKIKALVVACNTATSAAVNDIRKEYEIPVIGMEPALKPAVELGNPGIIAVMATPLTLKEEKFNVLYSKFNNEASIIPLPCPGLVELIESEAAPAQVTDYLELLLDGIDKSRISTVVLGCTHYSFIKKQILDTFGNNVRIIDGNAGTARHLINTLEARGLLAPGSREPKPAAVEFITTGDKNKIVPACRRFLEKALAGDMQM